MNEVRKNSSNPPARLKDRVLKYSESQNWEEAVKEWSFNKYFYNANKWVCCPCSPRAIKHVVLIKNNINGHTMEIDIKCAETYFGIENIRKFKESIQRLHENIDWGMQKEIVDYLYKNKCIGDADYMNYEIASQRRESKHPYSNQIIKERQRINKVFLNYTDYDNKDFFVTIDRLISIADHYPEEIDLYSLCGIRDRALQSGNADIHVLPNIKVEDDGINSCSNDRWDEIFDDYYRMRNVDYNECLTWHLREKEYINKITKYVHPFKPLETIKEEYEQDRITKVAHKKDIDNSIAEEQLDVNKEPKMIDVNTLLIEGRLNIDEEQMKKDINMHLADGLEEAQIIIDLNDPDDVDYDYDDDWDEDNFEEDDFAIYGNETMFRKFYKMLLDWIVKEMQEKGVEPSSTRSLSYSLKAIVDFLDIPIITDTYNKYFPRSFYELMVGSDLSIKYTYQIVDWLLRNSRPKTKSSIKRKLWNFLCKYQFELVHTDKVTRFLSSEHKRDSEIGIFQVRI